MGFLKKWNPPLGKWDGNGISVFSMPMLYSVLFILFAPGARGRIRPDTDEKCGTWAELGECEKNSEFMQSACATSCSTATTKVTQLQKECAGYAQAGECVRNPAFMLSTCRKECDTWEQQQGIVIDRDWRCVEWSIAGKCKNPTDFIVANCNTSCTINQRCQASNYSGWSIGICDKALRCEAVNKKRNCDALAKKGKCQTDARNMAINCLATCAATDVDAVLSAQRPEHRAKISRFDVAVSYARKHERCWLPGWSGQNHYSAPRDFEWAGVSARPLCHTRPLRPTRPVAVVTPPASSTARPQPHRMEPGSPNPWGRFPWCCRANAANTTNYGTIYYGTAHYGTAHYGTAHYGTTYYGRADAANTVRGTAQKRLGTAWIPSQVLTQRKPVTDRYS